MDTFPYVILPTYSLPGADLAVQSGDKAKDEKTCEEKVLDYSRHCKASIHFAQRMIS